LVDALAHRSFKAKVSAIDPLIGQSRTVQVQATMANPDSLLKAGMYASIQVARRDTQAVLPVPETAVTYTAYCDTVFVAHPDDQQ
ncbi:efflux RND transporter periplasmic adaptor subunit, partial [Pseudomonas sp. SIMBA_044]|uniref:efflux RND transporter periplasmic adaptor subunit n=1 Tax=Pseudomonas sp. SIMBA_044 TaxID=3085785 RepID=UPI00397E89B9